MNIVMNIVGYIGNTIVTKNQDIDMLVEKTSFDLQTAVFHMFHQALPQTSSYSALSAHNNSLGYVNES